MISPCATIINENFSNTQFPINTDPSLSWSIDAPDNETSWTRSPISSTATTGSVRIRSRYFDCYNKHNLYYSNIFNLSISIFIYQRVSISNG